MSPIPAPTGTQPMTVNPQLTDIYHYYYTPEKHQHCPEHSCTTTKYDCEHASTNHTEHGNCHHSRVRRLLLATLVAIVMLAAVLAYSCLGDLLELKSGNLFKRAGDATGDNNGTFVDHKLYLIVIFVGLLLVVILAVMLSAWCCRGAFENPLCCPCYLCACCGGLACLECIGCGLCAEGVDQM